MDLFAKYAFCFHGSILNDSGLYFVGYFPYAGVS